MLFRDDVVNLFQQWPATRHKHHCATLREGNVARKRRFHETLRGRSRIDFPIRYPFSDIVPEAIPAANGSGPLRCKLSSTMWRFAEQMVRRIA